MMSTTTNMSYEYTLSKRKIVKYYDDEWIDEKSFLWSRDFEERNDDDDDDDDDDDEYDNKYVIWIHTVKTKDRTYYDDEWIDEKSFLWSRDFEERNDDDDEYNNNKFNGYTHACHAHWSSWIRYIRRNSDFFTFSRRFFIFLSLSLYLVYESIGS